MYSPQKLTGAGSEEKKQSTQKGWLVPRVKKNDFPKKLTGAESEKIIHPKSWLVPRVKEMIHPKSWLLLKVNKLITQKATGANSEDNSFLPKS